jgi:hypothetical protein
LKHKPGTIAPGDPMRTAAFLLALIATPAAAQDAIPLKWSLKEGDKFFAKNVTDMDMSMMVMGQTIDVKMNITAVQRFKIIAAKQDATTVEMTTLSMDMTTGGPANIPGLGALGERMKGATLTAVLDDNMTVTKIQGYDKFLDKLAGDDEAMRKQMQQQFSESTMSQMFSQVFSFGNNKPVKVGDTWPRTEKMTVGGLDSVVKMKYKLDSVTDGIAKMGWTGDMTLKAGATLPGLPEGFKVDKFEMKADKLGGSMKFDTKAGRLTESTQDADMNGSITVALAGQKIDMTMKIKVKQKVVIDEKNPIKD